MHFVAKKLKQPSLVSVTKNRKWTLFTDIDD